MFLHIVHWIIVTLVFILIMIKYEFSTHVYFTLLLILSLDLFFVYTKYKQHKTEQFEETTLHPLDTVGMKKVFEIPGIIQDNVVDGVQTMIDSTSADDEMSTIYDTNDRYKDVQVRKAYKHIDYLLEKIKRFDSKIYESMVPQWTDQEYEEMNKDDEEGLKQKKQ